MLAQALPRRPHQCYVVGTDVGLSGPLRRGRRFRNERPSSPALIEIEPTLRPSSVAIRREDRLPA
jgi:hypothetical protein